MNSSIETQGDLDSQRSMETTVVQTPGRSPLRRGNKRSTYIFYIICVCCAGAIVYIAVRVFGTSPLLQTPKLSITSEPENCLIVINGQFIGTTPVSYYEMQAGTIVLTLSKEGFIAKDSTITIHDGDNIGLAFTLKKKEAVLPPTAQENVSKEKPILMGTLNVSSIPPSMIFVDKELRASQQSTASVVSVAAGKHILRFESVTYGSYGIYQVPVFVRENSPTTVTCYFESYLNFGVRGESEWGSIMIDGKSIDQLAPIARYPLSAGKHRIIVTRKGYDTIEGERVIEITPSLEERVIPLIFTLKKRESL